MLFRSPCGCNRNLIIVAGKEMLRKQHFRELRGQNKNQLECRASDDGETTVNSKIILKCWLDNVFNLEPEEICFNVPISNLFEEKRRFEFTHYVKKYQFGLCYERNDANLNDEKINILSKYMKDQFLYVTDISNAGIKWQYPEFMMKIQKFQEFCILLNTHGGFEYYNAKLKVVRYEKKYNGLWEELIIVDGKLSDFSIDAEGSVFYKEELVRTMVSAKIADFEQEQSEQEAESNRRKKEREEKQEADRKTAKEREEKQIDQLRKAKQQKEEAKRMREEEAQKVREDYFLKHPKIKLLVDYISSLKRIEAKQGDGNAKKRNENININKVTYEIDKQRITVWDKENIKYYIFVSDMNTNDIRESNTGTAYMWVDLSIYEKDSVIAEFQKECTCVEQGMVNTIYCTATFECTHIEKNTTLCRQPTSQCSFKDSRW